LDEQLGRWASRQLDELMTDAASSPSSRSVELIEVNVDDLVALTGDQRRATDLESKAGPDRRLLLTESEADEVGLSLELQLTTSRIEVTPRRLVATWRFPVSPLITIDLGGDGFAFVDYAGHSASIRWGFSLVEGRRRPIGLQTMAGRVPEEIDSDQALKAFALDTALLSAAEVLLGRQARLTPIDQ